MNLSTSFSAGRRGVALPTYQAAASKWAIPFILHRSFQLMKLPRYIAALLLVTLSLLNAMGQQLPLFLNSSKDQDNFQSLRGVPISSTNNVPEGSDGRAPEQPPATVRQFQSLLSLSGSSRLATGSNASGGLVVRARWTGAGDPFVSASFTYLFGDVILPPEFDEYGVSLASTNAVTGRPPILASDYWWPEPYTTNGHAGAAYYWSPHAERVYATQAGTAVVRWRRALPGTPVGSPPNVTVAMVEGFPYTVYTKTEIVSGSPAKPSRRMYWTEGPFAQVGRPIQIPTDRIKDIKMVYNDQFPEFTPLVQVGTNQVRWEFPFDGTQFGPIAITNSLWYDRTLGSLRAYNVQDALVFVEFLGDKRGVLNGRDIHQQLGYEIVEVIQRPTAADVTTDLGERLTPYQGEPPDETPELFADPILNLGQQFAYRHSVAGTPEFEYYAVRETRNQDDYQMHWMEEGLLGLRWPYRYVRYKMVWPERVGSYSHYVRPAVVNEEEAKATAVALPAENAPQIAYQDPLDQPRGKLTENFTYYSWLTPQYPAHRALLQFNSGENVRFERVFSWLDDSLRNLVPGGSITHSNDFANDFAVTPGGASVYGDAYVTNGVLRLTDAAPSQNSLVILDDISGRDAVENFRATFRLRMAGSTATNGNPGYGFSFSFGTAPSDVFPVDPNPAEFGFPDGLSIGFLIWATNSQTLAVRLDGRNVAFANVAPIATGLAPVEIVLKSGGLLDVSYRNVFILTNVPTGYTPRRGRFGLAARTGLLANQTHWVDDLSITLNEGAYQTNPGLVGTVATNLLQWNSEAGGFYWPNASNRPRVVDATAFVGQRITAPVDELGIGQDAGFIQLSQGDSYHPGAYVNPFVNGFDLANQGAIIPVNAIPGKNLLEVWWFRQNEVDATLGFKNVFWPSVIGRYTTAWPTDASEIILASNDGSSPLPSLEAKGKIYVQNDATQPGYNPNEEHALMQGGQAYALRDDLNLTDPAVPAVLQSPEATYSSDPFVLLEYTESDGKPAVRPFHVVREKPEAGITFEYQKRAAQILQPPMPLPLLGAAFAPKIPGTPRQALNEELVAWTVTDSQQDATDTELWTFTTDTTNGFLPFRSLALQNTNVSPYVTWWVFGTNVTENTVEGVVSTNRPATLGALLRPDVTDPSAFVYSILGKTSETPFPTGKAVFAWPTLRHGMMVEVVPCPDCAGNEVALRYGDLNVDDLAALASGAEMVLAPAVSGLPNNVFDGQRLAWNELPFTLSDLDLQSRYTSATLADRKGNVWVYRGPHEPDRPEAFSMQYYYNTLPGFFFPTLAYGAQPPAGTVTPYSRKKDMNGLFIGDPVYGNADGDQKGDRNPLPITYHPYWPEDAPVLQMAETLTTPKRGLPAVRGQTSLEVLYQQSQLVVSNSLLTLKSDRTSVVLHDPTREKTIAFNLTNLPAAIRTESSRGKIWFPNLPPHLVKRFWLDPNRGVNGALVFSGEFVDAPLGDKYLLLNVAGTLDAKTLRDLCPPELNDPKKGEWDTAIDGLSTGMEKFVENPAVPGTYIPGSTNTIGLDQVAEVTDDDVAVDSYALTAIGPGTGYVTLIAGNGLAFTPEGEPVSMEVIRVAPNLYRGEVAVVESENPLNEKLTLQQVVDLAGHAEDYDFEWRITAPVDGQPPETYSRQEWLASLGDPWSHVPFPLATDRAASIEGVSPGRVVRDVSDSVVPVSSIPFTSVAPEGDLFRFTLPTTAHHLAKGNRLVMSSADDVQVLVTVQDLPAPGNEVVVSVDPNQPGHLDATQIFRLSERALEGQPQSIAFTSFVVDTTQALLTEVWVSLSLAQDLGAKVYLNGGLVVTRGLPTADDNTIPENPPGLLTESLPPLDSYFRLPVSALAGAIEGPGGLRTNRLAVELFAPAVPGAQLPFKVRVQAIQSTDQVVAGGDWLPLDPAQFEDGVRAIVGEKADVRSLSDNYLTMRYRAKKPDHASWVSDPMNPGENIGWSQWTEPQLAEGWIKRVLKGINPFNQRVIDLYNNAVNTDVSILSQAGARWEGNIALNLESINNYGLIEIYETVLNRGKDLSINADINYGPANDALLLAAGYINDLYMLVGNEAAADAANPTIGIGTADNTYGDIATALFSFKGQLPSLLAEELALLRGRDDFLVPGVETRPVYNRLVWNYTRGIDAGEVIYALNYNILDQNTDGKVDALDAQVLYPQGHGDAYGHYLTALTGYYHLLLDPNFDWVPRSEAVTVLGKPVSVDYQDERKFAAAAGALARTGRQIFDLTWRQDYKSGPGQGWKHFRTTRENTKRTRYWGLDHWASRTGVGAYVNWITGNAILPYEDPDPTHADTIQQVDRKSVPELKELPSIVESLQTTMDNAESGLTPLGLPEDTVPFDLNPNGVVGGEGNTHFEQIYTRAKGALQNAVVAFDDAKDVTRLMRSEQDSLADLRAAVDKQELAYTNSLIELFGTPYPEDIGPGRTYRTGFVGPDSVHYMYVDNVELDFRSPTGASLLVPSEDVSWSIDTQTFTANWLDANGISDFNFIQPARNGEVDGNDALEAWTTNGTLHVDYNLASHGFFQKPKSWVGRRASPGKIQQAISDIIKARNAAFNAFYWADAAKYDLDWALQQFQRKKASHQFLRDLAAAQLAIDEVEEAAKLAFETFEKISAAEKVSAKNLAEIAKQGIPLSLIAGLASGGDTMSAARAALEATKTTVETTFSATEIVKFSILRGLEYANRLQQALVEFNVIAPEEWNQELRDAMDDLRDKVYGMNNEYSTINARLQELDDAQRNYRTLLAEGDRIQAEREIFRQRTAAIIQGYRTRDAAFRIFRNEKLERYKSLFDLAAQYAFMAAKAYDYETGLLGTDRGREFVNRIVNSRALGVVKNGEPQFAGSDTGDPGLSSVLAEMYGDWSVVKSRLGFNNPDAYGTTASLSYENYRIITNEVQWKEVMNLARKDNLLDDPDVRRYCIQIDDGTGLAVPGLIFEFSTAIGDGLNLFGHPLAPGDHKFSTSSFATKIFAVGVALEGYVGMDDPAANSGAVAGSGGTSPSDPSLIYLDPNALSANPYIYLIPVGVDSMRSPPLGDTSEIRTWNVDDVAIPLPFNIGGSDYSSVRLWQSADSLTEPPFTLRKHQAFRPVSSASVFDPSIYTSTGGLQRSQFTSNRLIGRSVWNSKWKIVIPGRELLADPNEGIERFLRTVKDIKLHFVTYSYSGN
jgi:hypothetical protein